MTFLIALGIYFAILLAIFYISKRSFGVPGLALAAGSLLATALSAQVTPLVISTIGATDGQVNQSMVAATLTLVPALVLLLFTVKAPTKIHRLYSSVLFAVLAVVLTYGSFANIVIMDDASQPLVDVALPYQASIMAATLVLALIDVVYARSGKEKGKKK